jgi:hypothetical protein
LLGYRTPSYQIEYFTEEQIRTCTKKFTGEERGGREGRWSRRRSQEGKAEERRERGRREGREGRIEGREGEEREGSTNNFFF